MEMLAKLRVLNQDGVTTAGNASGVNDGAVAMFIGSRAMGEKHGIKPVAKILSSASAGVPPRIMGIGPVPASQKALERAGLSIDDMDVIEINEAFAAVVIHAMRVLEIEEDVVNVNGGAIAMGHPLGCTGARMVTTLVHEMRRRNAKHGLASLCVGVGQGLATLFERDCASRCGIS